MDGLTGVTLNALAIVNYILITFCNDTIKTICMLGNLHAILSSDELFFEIFLKILSGLPVFNQY